MNEPRRDRRLAPPETAGGAERPDVLNLYLSDLQRLFNSMDPSPFREKDLDPEAADYIVEWAEEAPADVPLGMVVHIGSNCDASLVQDSVHVYFQRRAVATRRRLHRLLHVGRVSLVIAIIFLAVVLIVSDWLADTLPRARTVEWIEDSLVIFAWVALWRPLEIFLYEWWPIRGEARLFDRLGAMTIDVVPDAPPSIGAGVPTPGAGA